MSAGIWVNAWRDAVSHYDTWSSLMATADIYGEGDHHLMILDYRSSLLNVLKGTTIEQKKKLQGHPVGL